MTDEQRGGFAEAIIKVAVALGASETRMRWRVQRLENRWRRLGRRTEQRLEQIRYKNKICPACRAINNPDDKRCSECGASLGSRLWQVLDRVGLVVPSVLSASTLMGICFIAVYARVLFAQTGGSAWSLDVYALLEHGANFAPLTVEKGQWWRLLASAVSHGGLVHLGFNLIALYIVGPEIEERYGRFVMPLLFAMTAVVGSLASVYLRSTPVPSIGASGGIMGLIGMTAVRGHLEGGAAGREVRDRMLKWTIYTFILGFAITGIDNWAHAGGLAAGAALGLIRPRLIAPHTRRVPLSLLGIAAIAAAVWLAVAPPQSAGARPEAPERFDPVTRVYAPAAEACDLAETDPEEAERRIAAIAAQVDQSPGPDPLERWCGEVEAMRRFCRSDDETWRRAMEGELQLERDWERTCAAIGAPRP